MKKQKNNLIAEHAKKCQKCSEICAGGLVLCPPKFLVYDCGGVRLALPPVEVRAGGAALAAKRWAQYAGLREKPACVQIRNEEGIIRCFRVIPILKVRYAITEETP